MKKSILIIAFAIATFSTVSCNKKENSEATTGHEGHNHKEGEAQKLAYECPMDCEKGKTYDKKGYKWVQRKSIRTYNYCW